MRCTRNGEVHTAFGVGGEIVEHAADTFERLAVEGTGQHLSRWLKHFDAAAEPAAGDKQRTGLAAGDGAGGIDAGIGDLREPGRRIELHDVAGVVVREEDGAVVGRDRAVDVVAFP